MIVLPWRGGPRLLAMVKAAARTATAMTDGHPSPRPLSSGPRAARAGCGSEAGRRCAATEVTIPRDKTLSRGANPPVGRGPRPRTRGPRRPAQPGPDVTHTSVTRADEVFGIPERHGTMLRWRALVRRTRSTGARPGDAGPAR